MSTMYIREYSHVAVDKDGRPVQAGLEDGNQTPQTVATDNTQSAAFQDTTRFVRISCDVRCYLDFGTNPTAAEGDGILVQADTPEFFGVTPGQKVAALEY